MARKGNWGKHQKEGQRRSCSKELGPGIWDQGFQLNGKKWRRRLCPISWAQATLWQVLQVINQLWHGVCSPHDTEEVKVPWTQVAMTWSQLWVPTALALFLTALLPFTSIIATGEKRKEEIKVLVIYVGKTRLMSTVSPQTDVLGCLPRHTSFWKAHTNFLIKRETLVILCHTTISPFLAGADWARNEKQTQANQPMTCAEPVAFLLSRI